MTRSKTVVGSIAAALLALPLSAALGEDASRLAPPHRLDTTQQQSSVNAVPGEKLDSGLGEMPHYREWAQHPSTQHLTAIANHVPGEKQDSGLGDLPPYSEWARNADLQHVAARAAK